MVDMRPFKGLRYNNSLSNYLGNLISPPYDILSPLEQKTLYERNSYNAVRLELAQESQGDTEIDNRYTRTAKTFDEWQDKGVLVPEQCPGMYSIEESFFLEGINQTRHCITGRVRLEEFGAGSIFPHEYTTPGPKQDRLALIKACNANFSSLLTLYSDTDGHIQSIIYNIKALNEPDISTEPIDNSMSYRMWVITNKDLVDTIQKSMASKAVYLADGHHRYETALEYRDFLKSVGRLTSSEHPANFVMMSLVAMEDKGLLISPYHRIIGGLSEQENKSVWNKILQIFDIEEIKSSSNSPKRIYEICATKLKEKSNDKIVFGIFTKNQQKSFILELKDSEKLASNTSSAERSEPMFLSESVIKPVLGQYRESKAVSFLHEGQEAIELVQGKEQQMAILLRPMPMDLFREVVTIGDRLPPKSTYFYPKLPTGLVFNLL